MSTYLYLQCLDHDPPLRSDEESGQHLYDLPTIRAALADREAAITRSQLNGTQGYWSFERNTAQFLAKHRLCRIGIIDEYDREHPNTDDEVTSDVVSD